MSHDYIFTTWVYTSAQVTTLLPHIAAMNSDLEGSNKASLPPRPDPWAHSPLLIGNCEDHIIMTACVAKPSLTHEQLFHGHAHVTRNSFMTKHM